MKPEYIAIFSVLVAVVNLLLTNISNFIGSRIAVTRAEVKTEMRIDALEKEIKELKTENMQLKAEMIYLERKAVRIARQERTNEEEIETS